MKLLFRTYGLFAALAMLSTSLSCYAGPREEMRIGSKKFTESVILADLMGQISDSSGAMIVQRQELGGTRLLWDALLAGEIDAYPEYTGTLAEEILADENVAGDASLDRALEKRGIKKSKPLGFSNSYALGMRREQAEQLSMDNISDLSRRSFLKFGVSDEFLGRRDGWPSLRAAYGLQPADIRGLDHDIAYKALIDGSIDVIDLYTTDAEVGDPRIRMLKDNLRHFPENKAIILYRADLERRAPKALTAMLRLEGRVDNSGMIAMNRAVKIDRRSEADVAAHFLATNLGVANVQEPSGLASRLLRRTIEHLRLTILSLAAAICTALPLGVLAAARPALGRVILAFASILQTIPSLALLVFMIPVLGVGAAPAIAALYLYSLLPIIRNTATGLVSIPSPIRNSAIALGLTPFRRLVLIDLPIASPSILAGMKIAAVINVGTATLGALVGAGGYGQPIFSGVRLDNFGMVLEGAIPAALLALGVEGLFDLAERRFAPQGIRLKPNASL